LEIVPPVIKLEGRAPASTTSLAVVLVLKIKQGKSFVPVMERSVAVQKDSGVTTGK